MAQKLGEHIRYEVVPMKSLDGAIAALPPGAEVSVTCSPVKGIGETLAITRSLAADGFVPIPHFAARMVESEAMLDEMASTLAELGITEIFVIAGDGDEPAGPCSDAIELIEMLLPRTSGLRHVGFGAYPDGHAFISDEALHEALHGKQEILAAAGVEGHVSTQLCFDPGTIESWLRAERAQGLTLPVHLGVAGVIDKTKLIKMGMRLGIGASLKYLRKNSKSLTQLLTSTSYDPSDLIEALAPVADELGIEGVHLFTFNQVEASRLWHEGVSV